jgi:hypothetical protein
MLNKSIFFTSMIDSGVLFASALALITVAIVIGIFIGTAYAIQISISYSTFAFVFVAMAGIGACVLTLGFVLKWKESYDLKPKKVGSAGGV